MNQKRYKAQTLRLSLMASALCSLVFFHACGDDDAVGTGSLDVLIETEDLIVDGLQPGDDTENIQDGWAVNFDKYIVAVGEVELQLSTDENKVEKSDEKPGLRPHPALRALPPLDLDRRHELRQARRLHRRRHLHLGREVLLVALRVHADLLDVGEERPQLVELPRGDRIVLVGVALGVVATMRRSIICTKRRRITSSVRCSRSA